MPLIPIVQEIGLRGIPIDHARRADMLFDLELKQRSVEAKLRSEGITAYASRQKLGWQLKSEFGVPLEALTDGGQLKTDLEVFGRMNFKYNTVREREGKKPKYPFLKGLINRARLDKARANIEAIVACGDGMLRTRLNACATATWRYASAGWGRKNVEGYCPTCKVWGRHGTNMQNIPKDNKELGVSVKELFVPRPGWRLGELDMRAFELVIQAYWMKCAKLIERLTVPNADPHSDHARAMWPDFDKNTPEGKRQRGSMKNVIYGMRGGGGDRALQIALAKKDEFFSLDEIAKFRAVIFRLYPEMEQSLEDLEEELQRQLTEGEVRMVRNFLGMPRVLFGREPLKEAIATIVSGSAAGIMNCIIKRLAVYHPEAYRYIVMQIHDSMFVHAPADVFPYVMSTVRSEMERAVWQWDEFVAYGVDMKATGVGGVPVWDAKTEAFIAPSWASMSDYAEAA